jgi:hypothetical protein
MIIRASELNNFLSCSQYLHYWLQGEEQEWSERVKRAFEEGILHEPAILNYALEALGLEEISRQAEGKRKVQGVVLTATADMLASANGEKVVVEAKFLKARAIANILNGGENPYLYQVLAYLFVFDAQKGYLVMRNKDTPINRVYEHFTIEIRRDDKVLRKAIREIKKKAAEDPKKEQSWKCSPTWCPYHYLCQPEIVKKQEEVPELEELIASYKELQEYSSGIEVEKKKLRDQIVKLMNEKELEFIETKAGTARLRRTYRKTLPDEILKQLEDKMILKEVITLEVK